MTYHHPVDAPFGLEDRPALWDTEGPDGMCSCGEDAHPGVDCDDIPVLRDHEQTKDVA